MTKWGIILMKESDAFCYWDAKSIVDTIVMMVNSFVGIVLLTVSLYRVLRTLQSRYDIDEDKKNTFQRVHLLLSCWGVAFLVENAYAIAIFMTRLKDKERCQIPDESIRYALLDKIPTFLIHSAYIKICQYNFRGFLTKVEVKTFAAQEIAFFKRLKIYYWLRIVILVCCLVGLLIFSEGRSAWISSTISILFVVLDSIMTCIILIRSLRIFLRKFQILGTLTGREKRRVVEFLTQLKTEYLVLVMANICSMITIITFFIIFPFFTQIGTCIEPFTSHIEFTIGHNILGIQIKKQVLYLYISYQWHGF